MRKFHEAKVDGRDEVEIWGTGTPRREFLHVDDLADACLFLMEHYDGRRAHQRRHRRGPAASASSPRLVRDIVAPRRASSPSTPPSPTARRASCSTSAACTRSGWRHRIELREGIESTYEWFLEHQRVLAGTS